MHHRRSIRRGIDRLPPRRRPAAWPAVQLAEAPRANLTRACVDRFDPAIDYVPDKATIDHVRFFHVSYFRHYKIIDFVPDVGSHETVRYVLVQCGTPLPRGIPGAHVVRVPIKRALLAKLEFALRTADRLWLFDAGGRLQAGAPEDLVLAGAFEHAFAAEGVTFDRQEGAFKTRSDARGLVSLVGDGLVAAWTVRALERAGYRVAADHAAAATTRIEIHQAGGCPEWRMRLGAHAVTHASLETLVAELKAINAPAAPSREGR